MFADDVVVGIDEIGVIAAVARHAVSPAAPV
jgi:hypothetical protein